EGRHDGSPDSAKPTSRPQKMVAQATGSRARRSLRRRPGMKCLEYVRKRSPSRRDGVIMYSRVSLQRSHVFSSVMESKATPTQSSYPPGTDRFFLRIGVGTKEIFAPPSEPDGPISGIRLSSWWLTFKKIGMPQCALALRRTSQPRRSRY